MAAAAFGPRPGGAAPKPAIEINLDRHYTSKVYTSGSSISGQVVVCCPRDVGFDRFEIAFLCIAQTRLDFVQQFPTQSYRTLMKLRMPLSDADLPSSRVFEAGRPYTIPFNFVVPHSLTLSSCSHHTVSPAVRDLHLRLPPTVGGWEGDDQAPDMAEIEYSVKARAYKKPAPGTKDVKILESSHAVKVMPATPEDAPLDITFRDERYKLSKTKTIRKSLFSNKAGQLTVSASQPGAIMLSADGRQASTTTARIELNFLPVATDIAAPKINSVSGKLHAITFFSAISAEDLPNLGSRGSYSSSHSLSYSSTTSLFTSPVDKVTWQQLPVNSGRRDSGYSSSQLDEPRGSDSDVAADGAAAQAKDGGKKYRSPIKYTSELEVPVTLPPSYKKVFIPTFHSCLVSRTYTLQLALSVGPTNTAFALQVPLQIGVETIYEPQGEPLPSFESVMALDGLSEADPYLHPRVIHVPPPEALNGSVLPGYDGRRLAVGMVR